MQREVFIISDDSDKEPGYFSDDSEVVCVSQPPSQLPPSSSAPPSSQEQAYDLSELDLGDESDVELDIGEVPAKAKFLKNGVASGSTSHGRIKQPSIATNQLKSVEKSDPDCNEAAFPPKRAKRGKQSEEQKEFKKVQKEIEKLRKKAAAAAKKEADKIAATTLRNVNKLVSDKKSTLKDITVELSSNLFSSSLSTSLKETMANFDSTVQPISDPVVKNTVTNMPTNLNALGLNLVRWQRRVTAIYDQNLKRWNPLEKLFIRTEGDDVLRSIDARNPSPSLRQQVEALRMALGPKHYIHLMIVGFKAKTSILQRVERELVELQVREGVYVEEVPNEKEAVTWLYNISADLGIKPYKLVERSHLAFYSAPSTDHQVGKTQWDTAKKMLARLPRLPDTGAAAIIKEYQSINSLMEAYNDAEAQGSSGALLLQNIEASKKRLGPVMSQRLHNVMWGRDPKAIVN
ncbi:hypothetical protein BU17DRAFT_72650 [Hysterangium stoloniferum]|nr:hypothetical protein BU17DRAFT_72726 [Hysterangium stoloniferum]KAF8491778.1 hypothetical protein BU17DRAFT_72650 [Hysterangium stoloniferum]